MAAQKSGQSGDDISEMVAVSVRNAIRITAYETGVFPVITSNESLVSLFLQLLSLSMVSSPRRTWTASL